MPYCLACFGRLLVTCNAVFALILGLVWIFGSWRPGRRPRPMQEPPLNHAPSWLQFEFEVHFGAACWRTSLCKQPPGLLMCISCFCSV